MLQEEKTKITKVTTIIIILNSNNTIIIILDNPERKIPIQDIFKKINTCPRVIMNIKDIIIHNMKDMSSIRHHNSYIAENYDHRISSNEYLDIIQEEYKVLQLMIQDLIIKI